MTVIYILLQIILQIEQRQVHISLAFLKFVSFHLAFMKDLYQYLFFLIKGNSKIFLLMHKGKVSENSVQCLYFCELLQRQHAQSSTTKPFPRNYTQHLTDQDTTAYNCVCKYLSLSWFLLCILSKMCLKVIASLPYAMSNHKVFIGMLSFMIR